VTEVVAERVQFMSRAKGAPAAAVSSAPAAFAGDEVPAAADDDVPF